jgi:glucosamine-6-phosphate deaminase
VTVRLVVHSAEEWGAAVAGMLAARLAAGPGLRLCLPTGKTPAPAYAALAERGGSLANAEVFLLDEFVLPDGHPARCDEMLRRDLLDRIPGGGVPVHRLDPQAESLEDECAGYEALVADGGLDLTLLGLGGNGHLGLNEPGSDPAGRTAVVDLHPETAAHAASYGDGAAPTQGLTMGLGTIMASREIWLLTTGWHKAEILERAMAGPVGPDIPASVLQGHPNTLVLTDAAAIGWGA